MHSAIETYIKQFAQPPDEQIQAFIAAGRSLFIPRKTAFIEVGNVCKEVAFIHSGILRYHVIDPTTGNDHTKDFSFPHSFCTAYTSVVTCQPSQIFVSAVTDAMLTVWPWSTLEELFECELAWANLGRRIAQHLYVRKEQREISFLLQSATERYRALLDTFPADLDAVPQYHIASYLGITPEALSRIKRQIHLDLHQ
ncbi:MAG: Crp/Fnr family transcriptional regulator [Chroococcidiopsis sp.]